MIAIRIICKMINPPAKDQTGIFNLFIETPPQQIYGCNAVGDAQLFAPPLSGVPRRTFFRTDSSALGRVTCQSSIFPGLDCRARLTNKKRASLYRYSLWTNDKSLNHSSTAD